MILLAGRTVGTRTLRVPAVLRQQMWDHVRRNGGSRVAPDNHSVLRLYCIGSVSDWARLAWMRSPARSHADDP